MSNTKTTIIDAMNAYFDAKSGKIPENITKHTPAPWYVSDEGLSVLNDDNYLCQILVSPNPGKGSYVSIEQGKINAKLIAASPSFFEYVLRKHNEGDASATEVLKANGYA